MSRDDYDRWNDILRRRFPTVGTAMSMCFGSEALLLLAVEHHVTGAPVVVTFDNANNRIECGRRMVHVNTCCTHLANGLVRGSSPCGELAGALDCIGLEFQEAIMVRRLREL